MSHHCHRCADPFPAGTNFNQRWCDACRPIIQAEQYREGKVKFQRKMNNDFCSDKGAHSLKQQIESYWQERGYSVRVKLEDAGFNPAMRSTRTDVRSDMKNGLPVKAGP